MKPRPLYPLWDWLFWVLGVPLLLVAAGGLLVIFTDAADLPFDNARLWWLAGAVPLAGLVYLHGLFRRRAAMNLFASAELSPLLVAGMSPTRQAMRAGLVVAALAMLVGAILGPRWGIYLEKQKVYGVDIVAALDVSRSMLAGDVEPSRLERAKMEIRQQLTERAVFHGTNRLALMAFAGSTSVRLPLTTDHTAFRSKLKALYVGAAPRGGTAIGRAIIEATDLFARSPEQATKIVLLFTDGEDHEGNAVEAAKLAYQEHNIRIFTIGIGDPSLTAGARVPADDSRRAKPMLHDGQIVFSKLDVVGLRAIADAGGGRYAPLDDLHLLVDAVAGMRKAELSTEERMRHRPRYQLFLVAALVMLGLELLISERRASVGDTPQRVWQQEGT